MGFCTNCGADVPEGARFCASCGIQLIYDKDTSKDINEDNKNKLAWTYEDDKTEKQMGILPGIIALCLAIAISALHYQCM